MKVSEVSPGNSVPFGSRLTSLDGLRGLAVLSVVLFHTLRLQNAGVFGEIWKRFHGSAWAGVDLFFVLSGFLITGILLDSRGQENYFRNFYARRTLRIFPLYYTVLAVALLVVPFVVGFPRLPAAYPRLLENQLWLWTYTQNYLQATTAHTLPGFGHFWSLAVEEQFYWFWPLVVCLLPRKALLRFCLIVCAILPFIRLALILSGEKTWAVRQYTHTRFDTLLYGAIVAIVIRESGLLEKFKPFSMAAAVVSTVALAAMAIKDGFVPYESLETMVVGYSAFGVVFAVLIGYLVSKPSRLSDLLSNQVVRWFGTYSYGIYVFHWPVTQAFQSLIEPRLASTKPAWISPVACFLTVLAASSLVAYLSFVLYESRFLKLKRFFAYSKTTGTPSAANDLLHLATGVQHTPSFAALEEAAANPQSEREVR